MSMYFYEQNRLSENNYFYFQFAKDFSFPLHLHRSFEFIYIRNGQMEIQVGNKKYLLQKNKAAFILPGQLHAYTTQEHSEGFLCIFSTDLVYDFYNYVKGKTAESPIFEFQSDCIEQLIDIDANPFTFKSALYNIVGQFLYNCKLINTTEENLELIEQIISYVQNHFNQQISLKDLSKKLGYHYNYISSYINKSLGTNFRSFVNMFRIDYACKLIEDGQQSFTEIAHQCGFENIRNFNRCFKLIKNCTPSEYANTKRINILDK